MLQNFYKKTTMKKIAILFSLLIFILPETFSQSYYFGIKGGPTLGIQQWDGSQRNPLLRYHGTLFIETMSDVGEIGLFAQAGYHQKGSSLQAFNAINFSGNPIRLSGQAFVFENIDLVLGVKQRVDYSFLGSRNAYYSFGIRGDYTVRNNLDQYSSFGSLYWPFPEFVRQWMVGASVSGGLEFDVSSHIGGVFELSLHPDFTNQYEQPPIPNVRNPWTGAINTLNARTIKNVAIEISVGFRFLREIEYID